MSRSKGGMLSPGYIVLLLAAFNFALCNAGPLPNVTMVDIGLKEGSCALGDVVYMSGDSFPGAGPCERCACAGGQVSCERQRCEPRPGCKAVHRPDHCCPTYQCECEQEGRVYGNGEKLVDPHDPCRVCYCQGGEVVCRRIACFLRDDCRPRLVPGRCCPEYDNCPLRGVTSLPGAASSLGVTSVEDAKGSVAPAQPVEPPKPVITIKEITPVSEIPVTDVKIKEILPSPGIEVEEYTSPKSQLIPREATSEKSTSNMESDAKLDSSDVKPVLSSSAPLTSKLATSSNSEVSNETPSANINVSTQGTTRDEVAPFKILNVVSMMGSPSEPDTRITPLTTKAPVIEEEDLSFLDHNPAFPPIPDDLSVLGNRDDEILPEQNLDVEHVSMDHEIVNVASPIVTEAPIFKEATTLSIVSSVATLTKETSLGSIESSTANHVEDAPPGTAKDNPMLNMRSVIPTEILNSPSLISDEATGDLLDVTDSPAPLSSTSEYFHSTEHLVSTSEENKEVAGLNIPKNISYTEENDPSVNTEDYISSSGSNDAVTPQVEQKFTESLSAVNEGSPDETTNSFSKSTDIISETEFSSIPIETSDQNPHETIDKDNNDTADSTVDSVEITSSKSFPNEAEAVTLSRDVSLEAKDQSLENGETTEFIFAPFGSQETSTDGIELVNIASGNDKKSVLENEKTTEFPVSAFGSQESSTDAVELINIASGDGKNSALIDPTSGRKTNVLTDLIKLVGDVASISDHTDAQEIDSQTSKPTTISDSEELIPVNVVSGYKSKNKNRNRNSINADVSIKTKFSKQKVIEIEGEDTYTITDPPPPHDKVEPTTQRAIIDNVSDDNNENKTEITGRKDIEIITQSYVPTINRRPTKVVMKKDNEKASSDESSEEDHIDTVAPVTVRDEAVSFNGENNTSAEAETSTEFQFKESEAVEQSTVGPGAAQ